MLLHLKFANRIVLMFFFTLFSSVVFAQQFKKWNDDLLNERYIKYYHVEAGIIIQKVISLDASSLNNSYIEIGLIINRISFPPDEFMKKGAQIIFEDNTVLFLNDPVSVFYLYSGTHELTIKHKLSDEELLLLQTKPMKYFRIYTTENKIDRYQKNDIRIAFSKISSEI